MYKCDKLREECAVFAVSTNVEEAVGITYNGLLALQHRGQEGAGIAVVEDNKIVCHKDVGLVSEVFTHEVLDTMPKSKVAIGHNRYSTTGTNVKENVGPFVTEYLTGRIATAHNGNITNAKVIKDELMSLGLNFHATSDSEVIASLIGYCIMKEGDSLAGIIRATKQLDGAFSLIILSGKNKITAVRDPNGYRPLCVGINERGIAIASESCGLEACGFEFMRDVKPGEIVVIEDGKVIQRSIELTRKEKNCGLCIFEYVYFARPDSIIDKLNVYEARVNMGKMLAKEFPVEADIVCGVPDSGLEAAMGYSDESGLPYKQGFVKNRYIGRSFIYPTQAQRENAVRLKLNPLGTNVSGKRIVLVDDSIVRGTTSAKIIKSLKQAGAKEVHMRISSPPFRFTCNYGTDIDSEENLIANKISIEEIGKQIGADSIGFISMEGLENACGNSNIGFCTHCFTGNSSRSVIAKDELAQ